MPTRVHTPPNCEAYESGISIFEGACRIAVDAAMTRGRKTATMAVLLMKAEVAADRSINTSRNSQGQRIRASISPTPFRTPLCWMPALSTNIAATVIVASLEKPESASRGVTRPSTITVARTSIATTSTGSFSVTKR